MAQPVKGIDALNRAFALADTTMRKQLPSVLKLHAEPVRLDAQRNALNIGTGFPWSRMRIGVTRGSVYVAPVQRGTRLFTRKRPRFDTRLRTRAMEPALDANRAKIEKSVDELVARIERQFNRG